MTIRFMAYRLMMRFVNLTSQVQTVSYTFRALIKDPRGDGSLAECNQGGDTTIVITINPTPSLTVDLPELVYCDSSSVIINVIDGLLSSTGATAYHLTRIYNGSNVVIEGESTGTEVSQAYGSFTDEVRNLTYQPQTIIYRFKPVILDPRGDGSLAECNQGGDTTIVITINPTPWLTVDVPEVIYCDSSTVSFTVTDGLTSSTGAQVYSVYRNYSNTDVHIEGEVPGLDDNQVYGVSLDDEIRNLTSQVQTVTYRFRALIKDPRGDGSLAECNQGGDTTIVITVNPTPVLSVILDENIYCDSSDVVFNVVDGLLNSTGTNAYHLTRTYNGSDVVIEGELPGTESSQVYGAFTDQVRNLTDQPQTVVYRFKPVILDPRGDGSLAECNQGGDTTIVITINPTPVLSVILDENIYCDSSDVIFNVIDGLLNSTGTNAYHLTRTYNGSDVVIEGELPGTESSQAYGAFTDQVRNLTDQPQTVVYRFKPVILDPRGDGSLAECNQGGDTTIVITINPTPRLTVSVPETIYCDSSTVSFTVTDGLTSSTGAQVYSVYRDYSDTDVHIEGEVPGLDDNQVYGVSLEDDIRNLTNQVQTVTYRFRALIKDPRGDSSLTSVTRAVIRRS